jgi:LacI family transcriptional regulator
LIFICRAGYNTISALAASPPNEDNGSPYLRIPPADGDAPGGGVASDLGFAPGMKSTFPKVTLQTLADQLGISTATVSRALKNNRTIHSKTRARVMAEAARLGYDRPLRGSLTKSDGLRVLLLLPPHAREMNLLIFPSYLRGITTAATALGCSLGVEEITDAQYGKMNRRSNLPRAIRSGRADVVVVTGNHHPEDVSILAQELPVVSLQWDYPAARVDLVAAFNSFGIAELVDALLRHGHRRLAWVGANYEASFFRERQAGFIQGCLQGRVLPAPEMYARLDQVDAPFLKGWIAQGVTALVTANDDVAFRVAEVCSRHAIRIPEELSLTGFDGSQQALRNGKRLTTYDPGLAELGRAAVELAVQRIRESGASRMLQSREGRLLEGETVANARS